MKPQTIHTIAVNAWADGDFDTALDAYEALADLDPRYHRFLLEKTEALLKAADLTETRLRVVKNAPRFSFILFDSQDEKLKNLLRQEREVANNIKEHLLQETYKALRWDRKVHPARLYKVREAAVKFAKAATQRGLNASRDR